MPEKEEKPITEEKKEEKPAPKDNLVETHHSLTIGGREIKYTVTTGTLVLKEESEKKGEQAGEAEGEKAKASVFFIAYTRDDQPDRSTRPITFSFNGGPGSSSVWLHLGVLGPRRVLMGDAGALLPPPYRLADNEFSLLDQTDLVFIDPVSTGFSRVIPGEKSRQFHGFKKDIESVGDFIRLYTTRYQRWTSPKFLIGESYGTTRAAGPAKGGISPLVRGDGRRPSRLRHPLDLDPLAAAHRDVDVLPARADADTDMASAPADAAHHQDGIFYFFRRPQVGRRKSHALPGPGYLALMPFFQSFVHASSSTIPQTRASVVRRAIGATSPFRKPA